MLFTLPYGMDSGSLLKVIMGPVEVKILLSFGRWLFHGQSCQISYFYIPEVVIIFFMNFNRQNLLDNTYGNSREILFDKLSKYL